MHWQPSMDPCFKFNVDGATFAQSQTMGIGVLVCDFAGRVTVMLSKSLPVPRPHKTEAKAMEEGVQFAWDVGIHDIVMESNLQIVISALMGSSDPLVVIANIIEGICQKLYEFRREIFLM